MGKFVFISLNNNVDGTDSSQILNKTKPFIYFSCLYKQKIHDCFLKSKIFLKKIYLS